MYDELVIGDIYDATIYGVTTNTYTVTTNAAGTTSGYLSVQPLQYHDDVYAWDVSPLTINEYIAQKIHDYFESNTEAIAKSLLQIFKSETSDDEDPGSDVCDCEMLNEFLESFKIRGRTTKNGI